MALACIVRQDAILIVSDSRAVGFSALTVEHALLFFLLLHVHFVPVHHGVVIVAPLLHLVSELGVLLRNLDLLLQSLFFVVQLAEAIFEHLRLDLFLLHVQLLLELARAFHASRAVVGRVGPQVVQLDVAEAEVLADELLAGDFLRPKVK